MVKILFAIPFVATFIFSCNSETSPKVSNQVTDTVESTSGPYPKPKLANAANVNFDSVEIAIAAQMKAGGEGINKLNVSKEDSTMWLTSNIRKDHRIFGYALPDKTSQKLILFSVYTFDVEQNPHPLALGAYYDTNGMGDMVLKYAASEGNFVKAVVSKNNEPSWKVYFEKKWVEFEKQ